MLRVGWQNESIVYLVPELSTEEVTNSTLNLGPCILPTFNVPVQISRVKEHLKMDNIMELKHTTHSTNY